MWRQKRQEPAPFGRHFLPLGERIFYLATIACLCLYLRLDAPSAAAADGVPRWYRLMLEACVASLIFLTIPQWLFPVTVISPTGIRRNFAVGRRIRWEDIGDFTMGRAWGAQHVYVQLLNGRKRRLDGVPPTALAALRRQVGIGHVKMGSWWLVDYA